MAFDLSAVVSFNVGGQLFTTLRETLLKEGNSRLALIARGLLGSARDPVTGAYVIDRDPTHFQVILNWLRDGWCRLPRTADERRELLQEVRYYQLTGFEGWLRTQEILAETGAPQAQELLSNESPRLRTQRTGAYQSPQLPPQSAGSPYAQTGYAAYRSYSSPSSAPPVAGAGSGPGPNSPRAHMVATGRGLGSPAWASPAAVAVFPTSAAGSATMPGAASVAASLQPASAHLHHSAHIPTQVHAFAPPASPPPLNGTQNPQQFLTSAMYTVHHHHHPVPAQQQTLQQSTVPGPYGSPTRTSPHVTSGGALGPGGVGVGGAAATASAPAWGAAAGGSGGGGAGGAIASLREAFLAATSPQRPVPHVGPYSLPSTADDSGSWTSKYLKGNEGLRELVNTLLELAFMAPHRALHSGKSHLAISVACSHGQEASLVGSKEDHMRSKLLEVRVRGALGWSFELTLRPSSDVALWDKYGGVAAAVQDNWFVLGAILKDQFGVVLEEDTAARPACVACRRTCLAITLNKIY